MSLFLKIFIYLILERGERREKERETSMCQRHIYQLPLAYPPIGDLAHNPGPDWELNQQPFGLQAGAQSTATHPLRALITLNIAKA